MRRSLLVSALENVAYNHRFSSRQAVFEVGRVYLPEKGDGRLPLEERRLSILLSGPRRPGSVHPDVNGSELFDFFDLKGMLETLLVRLGIEAKDVEYTAKQGQSGFTATCAEVRLKGAAQGVLGEIHPLVLKAFDIPPEARVYALDLAITPLIKPTWRLQPMKPISSYQPVVEDLAFVIGEEVSAAEVARAISQGGGTQLTRVELFDIYRGSSIPEGKKSLAFQLTFESPDGPLSESRVQDLRNKIIRRVSGAVGGALRE
jgi:phenylalanyl-tRNA synthetase beta chain